MGLQLVIKKNAKNVADDNAPPRSFTIFVADDETGFIDLTKGKITLELGDEVTIGGTRGSDGTNHEIKLRQVDTPVTVDGVVNCTDYAAIVLMSAPFLKAP